MTLTNQEIQELLALPEIKECARCHETKPVLEFNKKTSSADGWSSYCKDCNKANLKKHYADNTQYYKDKAQRYRSELRELINQLKLSQGCMYCGFNSHPAALDFHHRNPEHKLFNIANVLHIISRDQLIIEIKKCDVICSNCHRIETARIVENKVRVLLPQL